jgi:pimeloyl-ACP methyl ester carboxylesterase
MKKKKIILLVSSFFFIFWLVQAQRTMKFREPDDKAKKEFDSLGIVLTTKTIRANNFNLHFAQVGSDTMPTLFFVHGSPGSWNVFKHYLQDKELLRRYRMISVDRPGFGYSEFNHAKNLEEQSTIIGHLLRSIQNNQPVFLIGHSLGGPLIAKLDMDNPGLASGLIILAGSLDPTAEKPEKWRPILFKTPLNYLVPGAWRPSNRELWYLKNDLQKLDKNLDKVTCAVWLVHGDKDNLVPLRNVSYAKEKLKNARSMEVTVLHNANHFIPWTHFTEIKQILLKLSEK